MNRSEIIKKGLPYFDGNKIRNTYHFSEMANKFLKDNKYCDFPLKSKDWVDFWLAERDKCINGIKIGEVYITGYNYFMLNYTPMQIAEDPTSKTTKFITAFPKFWLSHWQLFNIIDYCQKEGQHLSLLKVRGCGFSEIISALGARDYAIVERDKNQNKIFKTVFYYAADKDYLFGKGVFTRVLKKIDFLNVSTDGAMKHLSQIKDGAEERIAGKKTKSGDRIQTGGHVAANIVTEVDDVRGGSLNWAILEEFGSFKNSEKALNILRANVERSGVSIGNIIAGGTANEKSDYIEGLKKTMLHPSAFNMVKFKSKWKYPETEEDITDLENYELDPLKLIIPRESDEVGTGWFIPSYMGTAKFMDKDGNPLVREAIAHYSKERNIVLKGQDLSDATALFADHPFTIDEALIKTHGREYTSHSLSKQLVDIKIKQKGLKPERGFLHWVKDDVDRRTLIGVMFEPDIHGNIEIILHPDWTTENKRTTYFKNSQNIDKLYISGCDSIDQADNDSNTAGGSKLAMLVKKRINPNKGVQDYNNIYVSQYLQRSKTSVKEDWDNALKLTLYYNAIMALEYTKIGIKEYFIAKGFQKYLASRPTNISDNISQKAIASKIGIPMSSKVLDFGIQKIKLYLEDYTDNIFLIQLLEQLSEYTRENKSKYDLHSAMLMVEILDDEWREVLAKDSSKQQKVVLDWRWEYDEYGYKRRVIDQNTKAKDLLNLQTNKREVDFYDLANNKIVYK